MAKKKNKKLAKQMAMFEEGGLKDEGGSTDPISGNDVPIGSTKEEVRDDIPAQLSEGEFVFPADVVRFLGLEKLMMMRQEAKAGLKRMEDMGQMGNSEEATISDDVPFDMSDLDMEDDKEEEVPDSNFNRGGVVTMAEGGTTPTTENTDLKFNQGGTTRNYGDFYRFKMPGASGPNNFTKVYTKEGEQYFGFRPLSDGRVAAYRKHYASLDDEDAGKLSNKMDILDADTKFALTNPNTDIDPPMNPSLTVSEMANIKDGTVVSRYTPIPNQVYYKSFREYTSPKTPPKQVAETAKPKQVAEIAKPKQFAKPAKPITSMPFSSSSKVNQTESKNIKTPQINNLSTSTLPVNQLNKPNKIEPNKNAFLEFKTPQRTTTQQKPLNVKQAQVPIRNVSNLPDTKTFLSKQPIAKPVDYQSLIPQGEGKGEGNRFQNIIQGKINKNKSIENTKKELDDILNINPYNDNGSDENFESSSDGSKQGGINYADTDRFDLPDDARAALNQFSMAQLSMFSTLNPATSMFANFASAASMVAADITGKGVGFGSNMAAEKGKAQAIAFNTAMIDIQRDFGIKPGTPMQDWSEKAKNQIGIRGAYSLKTGTALHNARYNLPFESSLTKKEQSFIDKAKAQFNSIANLGSSDEERPNYDSPINSTDGVGIGKSTGVGSTTIGTEDVDPTNKDAMSKIDKDYDQDRAYYDAIGALIAAQISVAKQSEEEGGITGFGFEDSSMTQDLIELGFNANTRDEIAANGGAIEVKYNSNGQAYSVNDNGSFTHTDGTTVNFTDSKGNPGNAPKTPDAPPSRPTPTPVYTPPAYIPVDDSNNNNNDNSGDGGLDNSSDSFSDDGAGGWT
jgi:hypothetical protein